MLSNNNRGKFITFEYVDGGEARPFILRILKEFFPNGGAIHDREPTDGLFAHPLKMVLSKDWEEEVHWRELVHGFLADRSDHITKKRGLINILEQGTTIICDRYNLSTYAYQLPSEEYFEWYYTCSEGLLIPDLTIFLKYDIDSCVENALDILPYTSNEYSILNRKTRRNRDELRVEIQNTEEKYIKTVNFLRRKIPLQNIQIVEVNDEEGTWYTLKPIIQGCLQFSSGWK